MSQTTNLLLTIVLLTNLLAACGGTGELTVSDAWARPAAAGSNGALYFVIDNNSGQDDVLLRVESAAASALELHAVMMVDPAEVMDDMEMAEGDAIMQMTPQESVLIPAGESVLFAPGGLHVMMVGLNNTLVAGESFAVTLLFEHAGARSIEVTVEQR